MSEIKVEQPSPDRIMALNIPSEAKATGQWSVWTCEPSTFDWHYEQTEVAYVYEGRVMVKTADGEVEIKAGDLVTFPEGLSCTWQVVESTKKVYTFQ